MATRSEANLLSKAHLSRLFQRGAVIATLSLRRLWVVYKRTAVVQGVGSSMPGV